MTSVLKFLRCRSSGNHHKSSWNKGWTGSVGHFLNKNPKTRRRRKNSCAIMSNTLTHFRSSCLIMWNWMWLNLFLSGVGDPWGSTKLLLRMIIRFVSSLERAENMLTHIESTQIEKNSVRLEEELCVWIICICDRWGQKVLNFWAHWKYASSWFWFLSALTILVVGGNIPLGLGGQQRPNSTGISASSSLLCW